MSTYTSYLMLTRDFSRTLNNLGKRSEVSNPAQYYQANIGKVKSVDDLMKDNRLYNYAMKAYGLEDMAYAKAFMRKVLTSDLADPKSFVNKLTDKRYLEFATAFNFGSDGKVPTVTDVQSTLQEQEMIGLYNQKIADNDRLAKTKVSTYSTAIDAMTSVSQLFTPANREVLKFALTAYGMGEEAKYPNLPLLQEILTRGVGDTASPLYDTDVIANDAYRQKLMTFVSAFNFAPSGTVAAGGAQTLQQKSQTIAGYLELSGEASEATALNYTVDTYRQTIGNVTNVTGLMTNQLLITFIRTAYDLNEASHADIMAAFQSDPNDPASAANQLGLNYKRLAEDFNFDAAGNLPVGETLQSAEAMQRTVSRYLAFANSAASIETSESLTYRLTIDSPGWIENIDDFLKVLSGVSPQEVIPKTISDELAKTISKYIFDSFGLTYTPQTSQQFLRDVFLSDLDDPSSFANTLVDKRWAAMASLYNFDPATGNVASGGLQSSDQEKELAERFIGQGKGGNKAQQARFAFIYEMKGLQRYDLGNLEKVDDFLNSKSAFSFALVAFGLPTTSAPKEFYRQVLTDPVFASQQIDPRVRSFANAFNFQSNGDTPPGGAQTVLQRDDTIERFMGEAMPGSGAYNLRTAAEYVEKITDTRPLFTIRTVDAFLKADNAAAFDFAMAAFGIDMTKITKAEIGEILSSHLTDPESLARKMGGRYLELAQAYNFGVGGMVANGTPTQTTAQLNDTINRFLTNTNTASVSQTTGATSAFKQRVDSLQTKADLNRTKAVDEFLNDANLYNYALISYGLDPSTVRRSDIRAALIADKAKTSHLFPDERYRKLANALNFDPDGSVGTPRLPQTTSDAALLAKKYAATYPAEKRPDWAPNRPTEQEALISAETDYYATKIQQIGTAAEFAADQRMVNYVLKAFGFANNALRASDLTRILSSDLTDPKSFANTSKDIRYREMAALFNFDKDGKSKRIPEQAVQSSGAVYKTYSDYLQQTLEIEQGKSNQGVRLALYFARKAPTITSTYAILGDKALFEVVRTAIGMPQEAARADIDVLARTIEKKLKVADLKDPKKLEQFIRRFTTMYDVNGGGGGSGTTSNAVRLIQGDSGEIGFSQDMIASLQTMRARRF